MILPALSRRDFIKSGGALIVGFSLADVSLAQERSSMRAVVAGPPDPKLVDTWIAIHGDNTATAYIGYVELGQGGRDLLRSQ